ncbi:hypothetical protein G6F40_011637 [Rhizopus arrhizus]|nr:hypothetical protein G6F40_011637 [Rhizopus arrhizus]
MSELSTLKKSNLINFSKAIFIKLKNYQKTSDYYNKDDCYIKNQKVTYEIAIRLFDDSVKYNSDSSISEKRQRCDNKQKWIPLPPKDNKSPVSYKNRIIVYVSGSFSGPIKEILFVPTRWTIDATKKISKDPQGKPEFTYVTEAFTNQTSGLKRKVHVVLKYNSCSTIWNCDVMTVKNIRSIFTYISQHYNETPPEYMNSASYDDCMRAP